MLVHQLANGPFSFFYLSLPDETYRQCPAILTQHNIRLHGFARPLHVHGQPEHLQGRSRQLHTHKLPLLRRKLGSGSHEGNKFCFDAVISRPFRR
jgi:hypothetical protein